MKRVFFALCVLFISTLSCTVSPAHICGWIFPTLKYGREYNPERQKVGLPTIPADWEGMESCGYATWINPVTAEKVKNHIPVHWFKEVNYAYGTLIVENDKYYGKNDYMCDDGTCREQLTITYYFQADNNGIDGKWEAQLLSDETWNHSAEENISLDEAKKILETWGIQRLDYPYHGK